MWPGAVTRTMAVICANQDFICTSIQMSAVESRWNPVQASASVTWNRLLKMILSSFNLALARHLRGLRGWVVLTQMMLLGHRGGV